MYTKSIPSYRELEVCWELVKLVEITTTILFILRREFDSPSYRELEVWWELVELVDGPNIDAAGVLVHHQVVELQQSGAVDTTIRIRVNFSCRDPDQNPHKNAEFSNPNKMNVFIRKLKMRIYNYRKCQFSHERSIIVSNLAKFADSTIPIRRMQMTNRVRIKTLTVTDRKLFKHE